MRTKRTLITGSARPGDSYLAVLLPEKDFEVHGKSFSTGTCSISVRWSKCCATPTEVLRVGRLSHLLGGSELTDAR
jgi:GDP-D-mannose dehydratase